MEEEKSLVKKENINIFQTLRLKMVKQRKQITLAQYEKFPEYIKKDYGIVRKLFRQNTIKEEDLAKIPEISLLEVLKNNTSVMKKFFTNLTISKQAEFIKSNPILLARYYDLNERNDFARTVIESGDSGFIQCLETYADKKYFIEYMESHGILNEYLPSIIKFLDNSNQNTLIEKNPSLVVYLSKEQQIELLDNKSKYSQYVTSEIQLEYMQLHPEFISQATLDAKKLYIEMDKNNFSKLDKKSQAELLCINPDMYEMVDYDISLWIKSEEQTSDTRNLSSQMRYSILANLIKNDTNNSKILQRLGTNVSEVLRTGVFNELYLSDVNTVKEYVLHSKLLSALGTLTPSDYTLHGNQGGDAVYGLDGYIEEQFKIIKSLNMDQIKALIKTDINYVLPYLSVEMGKENPIEIAESQQKCKDLFRGVFGQEKLEQYEQCIDMIYEMQGMRNGEFGGYIRTLGESEIKDKEEFLKKGQIPLEELKLLFNPKILRSNSPEQIEEYLNGKMHGLDVGEKFREIIGRTYGKEARTILEARSNLDVHSINSLEVFDSRILDVYGQAFVHDCISYNVSDFSEFLDAIKDDKKSNLFKIYYDSLAEIYGKNVETMQKAISEFNYVEQLLENAQNVELTDEQYSNLVSVICSIKNPLNISTLDELQNYDKLVKDDFYKTAKRIISAIPNNAERNSDGAGVTMSDRVKSEISEKIFGIKFGSNEYGDSLEYICSLYDLSEEELRKEIYTEEERKILEIVNFIYNEKDTKKLLELSKLVMDEKNIANPIALQSALGKTKTEQTRILNNSLMSIEKMEVICQREEGKETPSVYKEEIDGVTIYHLNGEPGHILRHQMGSNASLDDIMNYEGQAGNTAACTRMSQIGVGGGAVYLAYMNVDEDMLIDVNNNDANTTHRPKAVKNSGLIGSKVKNAINMSSHGNEVAFYRRIRKHDKIGNHNKGGRRDPDAITVGPLMYKEWIPYAKKYGIPLLVEHYEMYKEQNVSVKRMEEEQHR